MCIKNMVQSGLTKDVEGINGLLTKDSLTKKLKDSDVDSQLLEAILVMYDHGLIEGISEEYYRSSRNLVSEVNFKKLKL